MFLSHSKEFQGLKTNIPGVLEAGIQWSFYNNYICRAMCGPFLDHKFVDLFQTSVGSWSERN